MPRSLAIVFALAFLLAAMPAQAARLIVVIDGVHSDKGDVYLALFNDPKTFPDGDHALRDGKAKASTKPITIVFDNLTPGAYAVASYHDENGNGKFDTNFIGYPLEGYALSNNLHPKLSTPSFKDAAVQLGDGTLTITLHMIY